MKKALDKFSKQSSSYKKFRPTYPEELYEFIYSNCLGFDTAGDCATGNGQVATHLAQKFRRVIATDISEQQLENAEPKENITYELCRAEKTPFEPNSFDLITVGQAVHWFDIPKFFKEAKRVLKPSGVLAFWGYGLIRVSPEVDRHIDHFYTEVVGPYWDFERKHVDSHYKTINFELEEMSAPADFKISSLWSLTQFEGYFNSWSAVQNFKEENFSNPVDEFIDKVKAVWHKEYLEVNFPIFLRIGKN